MEDRCDAINPWLEVPSWRTQLSPKTDDAATSRALGRWLHFYQHPITASEDVRALEVWAQNQSSCTGPQYLHQEEGSSTQGAGSPRSSPSHTISRPIPMPIRSVSSCSTPTHTPQDSLTSVGGDVQEAFAQSTRRNLRNDLLVAADSITNTMSSLVKELNSEVGSETDSNVDSEFGRAHFDDLVPSPTSEKAFLAQIHARKPGYSYSGAATGSLRSDIVTEDGDSYGRPDDEVYENDSVHQLEHELKMEEYLKQKLQDEAYQVSLQS